MQLIPQLTWWLDPTHDALGAARKELLRPIDVSGLSNYREPYDFAKDPPGDDIAVG